MKDLTLVVLAAGMGSRYGGLKQIEPVGKFKEIIADYSVYDAIRAGFKKVVFIIRKENYDYFKENITNRYKDKIEIDFAFQELDMIPNNVTLPPDRVKMLGTGHALLCAKEKINGNFVVINADDFCGAEAFRLATKFFEESTDPFEYLSVNYPFITTSSDNGKVKRGVVVSDENYISKIIECEIDEINGKFIGHALYDDIEMEIDPYQPVAVNFFAFKSSFWPILEKYFLDFIHSDIGLDNEFLLPQILKLAIRDYNIKIKGVISNSTWLGLTYKEDLEKMKESINELIERGDYPSNLWENNGR